MNESIYAKHNPGFQVILYVKAGSNDNYNVYFYNYFSSKSIVMEIGNHILASGLALNQAKKLVDEMVVD